MKTNKRWTIDEDRVVIAQVEKNPHNISEAFKAAEDILDGRTFCSIRYRYYDVILKGKSKLPTSYMYFTVGKNGTLPNRKFTNKKENIITHNKTSIFTKILKLLGIK